jgi:hypothetical protein
MKHAGLIGMMFVTLALAGCNRASPAYRPDASPDVQVASAAPPSAPSEPPRVPWVRVMDELDGSDIVRYVSGASEALVLGTHRVVVQIDSPGGDLQVAQRLVTLMEDARLAGVETECVVTAEAGPPPSTSCRGAGPGS